jgi:peptidoglycan hydrolase-like protein with peptidoglycan-binding domain
MQSLKFRKASPYLISRSFFLALSIALLPRGLHADSTEIVYPSDAGVINVQNYGAVGDGVTDDTAAIQNAISQNIGKNFETIIYFPAGTYLVSSTLLWQNASSTWYSRLMFQGENSDTTTIRLEDNDPLFQNPASSTAVIKMGSEDPFDPTQGSGYDGFNNYINDMTVDTGNGNPGAIGIDFQGNNFCGMDNVNIKTEDGQGVAGLSMTREYVGPCLFENIGITGFQYGIQTAQAEYSQTLEHILLSGQTVAGIFSTNQVLNIRDLESTDTVPAIINNANGNYGGISLISSVLDSPGSAVAAIQNSGGLFLQSVTVTGYNASVVDSVAGTTTGSIVNYYAPGTNFLQDGNGTPALPVEDTPTFDRSYYDLSNWANVVTYGADPTGAHDSTGAIQAALDSNADVVYFPPGTYKVLNTIHIRGTTKRLLGFSAAILPQGANFTNASSTTAVFKFESTSTDVMIDSLQFGTQSSAANLPGAIYVEDDSPMQLVIRHVPSYGTYYGMYQADPGNIVLGPLFVDDVAASNWAFQGPQQIFARQLDTEGTVPIKVDNDGASLWILGQKTEGTGTVISTEGGGTTQLIGALLYPDATVPASQPAFIVQNGSTASFVYNLLWFSAAQNYSLHAEYPSPPTLTTDTSADSITQTSATFVGAITAIGTGAPSVRGFVYGPDTTYGATTTDSGGPFSTGPFAASASSLTCGTDYHFRAFATNITGVGYGTDGSFTTNACPSAGGVGGGGSSAPLDFGYQDSVVPMATSSATSTPISSTSTAAMLATSTLSAASGPITPSTSMPATIPQLARNLTLGSTGDDVWTLQEFLTSEDYLGTGNETGYFGLRTQAALAGYQDENRIAPAVGYFGPLTRAAINRVLSTNTVSPAISPPPPNDFVEPLTQGDSGPDVASLQQMLASIPGVYPSGLVTGYFGLLTKQAVEKFQLKYGVVPSAADLGYGTVGPMTRELLQTLVPTHSD